MDVFATPELANDGTLTLPALRVKKASSLDGGRITTDGAGKLTVASVVPGNGFSGTVVLAKLTPTTGTNGSLTVLNGIITGYTAPT